MMRKYKVFLASSAELFMERKEIALMISRLNNAWVEKDIYLELVIWEGQKKRGQSGQKKRGQSRKKALRR